MAQEPESVGLIDSSPPIKFAQRLLHKYRLQPPVNVRSVLLQYAEVFEKVIPISGVDGVCLNLKTPRKRPRVIINSNNPPLRRRFTEAHELGHIIIPWHRGVIIDNLDEPLHIDPLSDYWTFEEEANQFAAELLIPSSWISKHLIQESDLANLHADICEQCSVSALAAARKLAPLLPSNIIFASEKNGTVEFSGRTQNTLANAPNWGDTFDPQLFEYASYHYSVKLPTRHLHWWKLPDSVSVATTDSRSWREILDQIVLDIGLPESEHRRYKMSVNGVLSAANSAVKHQGNHTSDSVIAACLQRFHDRPNFHDFAHHPNFMDFVIKRANELTK